MPDSLEIFLGSSSWIQKLDYESIPFRCHIFHAYGHLQRQFPQASKGNGTIIGFSSPRMTNDGMGNGQIVTTRKGNVPIDVTHKGKVQISTPSQGRGPSSSTSLDKGGFILAQSHAKGRGQKRAHLE